MKKRPARLYVAEALEDGRSSIAGEILFDETGRPVIGTSFQNVKDRANSVPGHRYRRTFDIITYRRVG